MTDEEAKPKEKKFKDVAVVRRGHEIVLPEGMGYNQGIEWLQRRRDEDEKIVAVQEDVDAYPMEGGYAFMRALQRTYGFTSLINTPTMFGPKPPQLIGLEIGIGETAQVPWGRMQVPDVEGWIGTTIATKDNDRFVFRIVGEVKQKEKHKVAALAALTRKIVAEESIYRGQAIRVKFQDPTEETADPYISPRFMDTSGVRANELVFSDEVMEQVNTSLFTPIERTELCRKYGIPRKRGVLLEGPYGTGKTLTAFVTAAKAVQNGWTFVYLDNVAQLKQAIMFAKQYEPAVIFAEDIDQVIGDQDRDEETNEILNTIDGVISKTSEILVCLTTNHVETINQAMLRPGRLDAVISVRPPDATAAEKLIRLYARGLLEKKQDLSGVGELIAGQQPAVIREAVERAKLRAVARLKEGEALTLRAADLELASKSMLSHLELLVPLEEDGRSDVEKAADSLADAYREVAEKNTQPQAANGAGQRRQLPSSTQ